jgi:hypothetical protein
MEQQPAQPSPAPAAAPAASPEPKGLEKVYKDYGIEESAASFKPETQAPQAPAQQQPAPQPQKFDPFDPSFPAHMQAVSQAAAQAQSALHQLQGQHTLLQRQLHAQRVEADLKQAVGVVAEKSGIDPDIAEVALEARARKDEKFLQIWNNRTKNPKVFQAALEAFSGEVKERFAVKQDPQLVENQRAVKASQQQMATTTRETDTDKWANMTPQERQAVRNRILRAG